MRRAVHGLSAWNKAEPNHQLGKFSGPRADLASDLRWSARTITLCLGRLPRVPRGSPPDLAWVWHDSSGVLRSDESLRQGFARHLDDDRITLHRRWQARVLLSATYDPHSARVDDNRAEP